MPPSSCRRFSAHKSAPMHLGLSRSRQRRRSATRTGWRSSEPKEEGAVKRRFVQTRLGLRRAGTRRISAGDPAHKRCARCAGWLPVEAFRVMPCRSKSEPWRQWKLSSWCRDCQREANRQWRESHREAYNARRRAEYAERRGESRERTCTECGVVFEGRLNQLVCGRRCRDARYRRLHPAEYAAKRRRKDARRRAREKTAAPVWHGARSVERAPGAGVVAWRAARSAAPCPPGCLNNEGTHRRVHASRGLLLRDFQV